MIKDLLQGKKVGVFAVVTIMSGVAGTIWAGALLWNQIQVNTANVQSIASYNDDEIWKDVEENNKIRLISQRLCKSYLHLKLRLKV